MKLASDWDVSGPRRDAEAIVRELRSLWKDWSDELSPRRTGIISKMLSHGRAGFIRTNEKESFYFAIKDWKDRKTHPIEGVQVTFVTRPGFDPKRQQSTTVACEVRTAPCLEAVKRVTD